MILYRLLDVWNIKILFVMYMFSESKIKYTSNLP